MIVEDVDIMDREQEIIYNTELKGIMFERDSRKVLSILRELTNGTDSETCMKNKKCGRIAMMALQAHYDGESEGVRRKQVARDDLQKLYYRNESTFSFERYVTKLKRIFNVLETYGVPMYEEQKVQYLLDKVQCPNNELKTEVRIFRSSHSRTFDEASIYIATVVSRIFPTNNPSSGRYNNRNVYHISRGVNNGSNGGRGGRFGHNNGQGRGRFQNDQRGGRFGGRNNSRGGRFFPNRGNNQSQHSTDNGVDISDVTRYFSDAEWIRLSYQTKNRISNDPRRLEAVQNDRNQRRRINQSSTSEAERNRIVAAIINGVQNSSRHESQQTTNPNRSIKYPTNGSRNVSSLHSVSGGTNNTTRTYDHNGNPTL